MKCEGMIRKKDFIRQVIMRDIVTKTAKDIENKYGIREYIVKYHEETINTGEPFGKMLTEYDILDLYLDGVTFQEIGYLKGISKEGVRYIFRRLPVNSEEVKLEHRKIRKQIWKRVQEAELRNLMERSDMTDKSMEFLTGYSKRYIGKLLREIKERE